MDVNCPRCGGPVSKSGGAGATAARISGGLVGMLLHQAFANYQCAKCGELKKAEFPPAVRSEMTSHAVRMVLIAVGVLAGAVVLLVLIGR